MAAATYTAHLVVATFYNNSYRPLALISKLISPGVQTYNSSFIGHEHALVTTVNGNVVALTECVVSNT